MDFKTQIPSLMVSMASNAFQGVTRKRLFRENYLLAGDFVAIMAALYEQCALIGRFFKEDTASLAELLTFKTSEGQWVPMLKELVDERLQRYHQIYGSDPDSLVFLVMATEWGTVGLTFPHGNVGSFDNLKQIESAAQAKVDTWNENMWKRVTVMLSEGIGFGLLHPEMTWELVSWNHKPVDLDDEGWKRFRSAGFATPKELETDSPQQAETAALGLVKSYVQQFRPELTDILDFLNRRGAPLAFMPKKKAQKHYDKATRALMNLFPLPDLVIDAASTNNANFLTNILLQSLNEAIRHLQAAVKLDSNFTYAFHNLALALFRLGEYKNLMMRAKQAKLEIALTSPKYKRDLKYLESNVKKAEHDINTTFELALDAVDRAISLQYEFPQAHNTRAIILAKLLRLDEALKETELALAQAPDYKNAIENQKKIKGLIWAADNLRPQ